MELLVLESLFQELRLFGWMAELVLRLHHSPVRHALVNKGAVVCNSHAGLQASRHIVVTVLVSGIDVTLVGKQG